MIPHTPRLMLRAKFWPLTQVKQICRLNITLHLTLLIRDIKKYPIDLVDTIICGPQFGLVISRDCFLLCYVTIAIVVMLSFPKLAYLDMKCCLKTRLTIHFQPFAQKAPAENSFVSFQNCAVSSKIKSDFSLKEFSVNVEMSLAVLCSFEYAGFPGNPQINQTEILSVYRNSLL